MVGHISLAYPSREYVVFYLFKWFVPAFAAPEKEEKGQFWVLKSLKTLVSVVFQKQDKKRMF
jgi:hypothetical protein